MAKSLITIAMLLLLFVLSPGVQASENHQHGEAVETVFSPIKVTLSLEEAPKLNGAFTVRYKVESREAFEDLSVRLLLPKQVEALSLERSTIDRIAADSVVEGTFELKIVDIGTFSIEVFVRTTDDPVYYMGGTGTLYFKARTDGISYQTTPYNERSTESRQAEKVEGDILPEKTEDPGTTPEPDPNYLQLKPIDAEWSQEIDSESPPSRGSVRFTGRWVYPDSNGTDRPVRWATVYFYDDDVLSGDDYLGSALTGTDGTFTSPWFNNSDGLLEGSFLDPYMVVAASNSAFTVRDASGDIYDGWTPQPTQNEVPDGTVNLGSWRTPSGENQAWWIFQFGNDAWNLFQNGGPGYTMPNLECRYPFEGWAHYHPGGQMHIPDANTARSPDVIVHEYGHFAMYHLYGNWFPTSYCPSPHYLNRCHHQNCAWTEGWAQFLAIAVYNSPVVHHVGSYSVNYENYSGISSWDNGDCVEGRVTGALNDMFDSADDGFDHYDGGFVRIYNVFESQNDNRLVEFWSAWKSYGYPDCAPVSAIKQNTIDYNATPSISGIPNRTIAAGAHQSFSLWGYASDAECSDAELSFRLVGSNTCGVTLSNYTINIDPSSGATPHYCDITVEVSDGSETNTDVFRVTVTCDNPVLSSFVINSGATNTCNRVVLLNNSCTGSPTQYIASENSNFSGATWRTYSTAPSFTLSTGCGTKRVYLKTKNACGESNVRNDVITLLQTPAVSSFAINSGATSTCNRTVTLNVSATCTPTQYLASENSNFGGAIWRTYSTAPSFTLSAGCGSKRVYLKVKNGCGESSVSNDVITLLQTPSLTSFAINGGATSTCNRTVTLTNTGTCAPTEFMACENESFSGCNWQSYTGSSSFTLSSGCGVKRVYFKVKNSCGESNTRSNEILLLQTPGLSSFAINNGDATTGSQVVTLNNTATCIPGEYQACEDPSFSGCSWQAYSAAPSFTLSAGYGTKIVYLRTRNACGTSATVNDQIEYVDDDPRGSLAGEVYLWSAAGTKLCDVTVDLTGPATDATVTDAVGQYQFADLALETYTVTPSRDVNDPGMSVSDIIKIRRHLAFLERFPSGYQYIAADVSGDCNVSVSDVIKIRRCLAFIDTAPCTGWAFVDATFTISTSNWCTAPSYVQLPVAGEMTGVDFVGVRLGDVTGNASISTCGPFAVDRDTPDLATAGKLTVAVGAGISDASGTIVVPITAAQDLVVAGLELHLTYSSGNLEFVGLESQLLGGATWSHDRSTIHLVWEDIDRPLDLSGDASLLGLKFAATSDGQPELSIEFTRAEFADETGLVYDLELVGGVVVMSGGAPRSEMPHRFVLGEAHPNPFNPVTTITFSLPVATQTTLSVYNTLGQKVATLADAYYPAGEHVVEWDGSNAASGVYFYRLEAGSFMETKKMVLMK